MATYRAAVIGLTGIGAAPFQDAPEPVLGAIMPHSHVAAYTTVPQTTVVAVCDLVPALLEQVREAWRPALPDLRAYTDYREMLAREQVDILSVVTPDHRHAQIVLDAVAAGVKGIFCEKPIATTLADADRMIAACREKGVALLIDHTRRWSPDCVAARRLVRTGAIGTLRRIVATQGGPRAMLFRNGTHLVDMVCFFAGADPAWLVGELDDEHQAYGPRYAGDGGRDPAFDPGGSAFIHFQNGVRAFVNASKRTMYNFELDLVGETGRIRIGAGVAELWRPGQDGTAVSRLPVPHTTKGDMVAAVEDIISMLENGTPGTSTGADGRRTLSILLGILQSSAAGSKRVDFPVTDL